MTIRKAALVAAIGCAIKLVPHAYFFFLGVVSLIRLAHFALTTIGVFIPAVVLPVFFVFLYGEARGRIKPEARGIAAITAAALMLISEMFVIWAMHATAIIRPNVTVSFSVPLALVSQSIWLVRRLLWVAIFIGFSANILPTMSRMISKLAAVLVICYVASVILLWYMQAYFPNPQSTAQSHPFWLNARLLDIFSVIQWAGVPVLLVFLITVWRRWQAQLSVHENVLG